MSGSLIFVLGDQLCPDIAALRAGAPGVDTVFMAEVLEEATYVPHHKKKLAFVFSAMRHFAEELRGMGWIVDYVRLDDKGNSGSLIGEAERAVARHGATSVRMTEPGEHRLTEQLAGWNPGVPVEIHEDDRFLCTHAEFARWAEGRKQLRMEFFYREMRRKTGLLMDGDEPAGGKWNYDSDNRKPAKGDLFMPRPPQFRPDQITQDVLDLVERRFPDNFGTLEPFWFATTRTQAEQAADHFLAEALASFGDYQDAMLADEPFLYHSILSIYVNAGLLDPLALCERVQAAWQDGSVPLNAAEGFIRQIIGWREYVRGIYWLQGPDYVDRNFFDADRALPDFYWTGQTDMACLRAAIGQTRDEAYAHHIQRLMVTGNFATLIGANPREVHEWYLAVYADAYEWVELPNTLGMSQFADGGLLASKPYAGGGNYINKMSDYCGGCAYSVSKKAGEGSCPFNTLYWDFLIRNREKLGKNHRLAQVYRTWDRMASDRQSEYRATAAKFLSTLG